MAVNTKKHSKGRRASALMFAGIVAVCTLMIAVIAIAVGDRYRYRIDLGVAGGQRLSERTRTVLNTLREEHTLLVAGDLAGADVRGLSDLLDEMHASNPKFDYKLVNITQPQGVQALNDSIAQLVQREKSALTLASQRIATLVQGAGQLSAFINTTASPALLEVAGLIGDAPADRTNKDYFTQAAAQLRLAARDLTDAAKRAEDRLSDASSVQVPRTDAAGAILKSGLSALTEQIGAISENVTVFSALQTSAAARAKQFVPILKAKRDEAAVLADSAGRLPPLDVHRIADSFASGSGALVIGPLGDAQRPSIVGVSLDAMVGTGTEGAWSAERAEEAITTGLMLMTDGRGPIVVLVHGEAREVLSDRSVTILDAARSRLAARGIDLVEWACAVRTTEPPLGDLLKSQDRAIVYLVLSPDSTGTATGGSGSGVERAEKLGKAVTMLLSRGENVCVSLNPSIVATYGDTDPVVKALAPLGVSASSGKPLLREVFVQGARNVQTDFVVTGAVTPESTVGRAVAGLPVTLPWPLELTIEARAQVTIQPILTLAGNTSGVWGESQWLALWQTPRERRGNMSELPRFDEARDSRPAAPVVAVQVQLPRTSAQNKPSDVGPLESFQRAVVISSNAWLVDSVSQRQTVVDGRRVMLSPGNLELMEAVVLFLAGKDDYIATSAAGKPPPLIVAIEERKLSAIRLAIIAGLPLLALLIGGCVALIRAR